MTKRRSRGIVRHRNCGISKLQSARVSLAEDPAFPADGSSRLHFPSARLPHARAKVYKPALVSRFRSSHTLSARSHANFGIKRDTGKYIILVRFLDLKFL